MVTGSSWFASIEIPRRGGLGFEEHILSGKSGRMPGGSTSAFELSPHRRLSSTGYFAASGNGCARPVIIRTRQIRPAGEISTVIISNHWRKRVRAVRNVAFRSISEISGSYKMIEHL